MACIVVVEDKVENAELMTYLLRAFGHEAVVAVNGAEGVAMVDELRPDLVVMDLHMPVMDGYEAARTIKADHRLRHIPLVAVTAYAMVGDLEKVLDAGFDGYLTKPINPETFVQSLEERITNREA